MTSSLRIFDEYTIQLRPTFILIFPTTFNHNIIYLPYGIIRLHHPNWKKLRLFYESKHMLYKIR